MKIDEKSQNININQLIVMDWFRLVSIDKFINCVRQGWILVIPIDMLAKLITTVTSHETLLYSTIATFHQSRLAPHTTPLIYTQSPGKPDRLFSHSQKLKSDQDYLHHSGVIPLVCVLYSILQYFFLNSFCFLSYELVDKDHFQSPKIMSYMK